MLFRTVSTLFLSFLLLIVLAPILFIVYFPVFIYRQCIVLLSKLLRPDLLAVVRARDAVLANDDYDTVPKSTILVPVIVDGDVELESLRKKVGLEVVQARISAKEGLKYPELQQYFVQWCGYLFKKQETSFDVNEHVRLWNGATEEASESDLYAVRRNLLQAPYPSQRSPWEFILVRNYRANETDQQRSVIIAKFHHGLVDGYSLLGLLLNSVKEKSETPGKEVKPNFIRRSLLSRLCFLLKAVLLAPCTLLEQAPKFHQGNIFDPTKVKNTAKRHPVSTELPVSCVKSIARNSQTCFTSVLLAGLTGGIRKYLLSNGKPVPKTIDVSIPLPWPGHPKRIRNHFTFAGLDLPVSIPDAHLRLQNLHKKIQTLKHSVAPTVNFGLVPLTGALPSGLLKQILKNTPSSILMSSFPGPQTGADLFGHEILHPYFEGGYSQGLLGMGVTMLSQGGKVHVTLNPEESVIPTKAKSQELLRFITDEIYALEQCSTV